VTGNNPSEIYGTIKSSIQGADFYLLNPNGVLFGESAQLDITGSFYATTANYIDFADGYRLDTAVNPNMTFTSAAPSDFGFTTTSPGNIEVSKSELSVNDGKTISLIGGDITLDDATLKVNDGTINVASVASAGEVSLASDNVQLEGFSDLGDVTLANGASIDASGNSGGQVVIRNGNLIMMSSSIEANSEDRGSSDSKININVNAKESIILEHSSSITSNADLFSQVTTKGVSLEAPKITITSYSGVESNTKSIFGGNSGNINLQSKELTISNYGNVNTDTTNMGHAGNITISSDNVTINGGGYIASSSSGEGDSGNIRIISKNLSITGPEISSDPYGEDATGIYTAKTHKDSLGGYINIVNSATIKMDSRAGIFTDNYGAVSGGDINITSQDIQISRGSVIGSTSQIDGNGGDIDITARLLNITGIHEDYALAPSGSIDFHESGIFTMGSFTPGSSANSGDISLNVNSLNVLDGARIQALHFFSTGTVGAISINAENIKISGTNQYKYRTLVNANLPKDIAIESSSSAIESSSLFLGISPISLPPERGTISISSDNLELSSNGNISSATNGYIDSGDINIATNQLNISSGSFITSAADQGRGNAGEINIKANDIYIDGIESTKGTTGVFSNTDYTGGKGGSINIDSNTLGLSNGAIITSNTEGDSDGGDITINSSNRVHIANSAISAKASEPSLADAGNINIHTKLLAMNSGELLTSSIQGRGGDINIRVNIIALSVDSNINAESTYSISGQKRVVTDYNISSSLVKLSDNTNNPVDLSTDACSNNTDNRSNFFVASNLSSASQSPLTPSDFNLKHLTNFKNSDEIKIGQTNFTSAQNFDISLEDHLRTSLTDCYYTK
jgi:large exoprotein involved in heme utilization and adhesion